MSSVYRVGEFAEKVGRSVSTIRRWESEGKLTARRSPSGQRYFDDTDVRRIMQPGFNDSTRVTIVYCRVSSANQRADLAWQVTAMEQFCLARGLTVDEWVKEVGGGMDLRRKKLLTVMDSIERGQVATLIVAHQDRLARFGFDYLEHVATKNGCEILVVNQESLSPDREMVEDLLAIVHTFSHRLSGLRRYEKTLTAELAQEGDRK
jgi:putative resolvase